MPVVAVGVMVLCAGQPAYVEIGALMGESGVVSEEFQWVPNGDPSDWYQRATELVATGKSDAARQLLEHLVTDDPTSQSELEAYARALLDARGFVEESVTFSQLHEVAPANDLFRRGMGMSMGQGQEFTAAREQLAMALVMKPEKAEHSRALAQVTATLPPRVAGGLPLTGPVSP